MCWGIGVLLCAHGSQILPCLTSFFCRSKRDRQTLNASCFYAGPFIGGAVKWVDRSLFVELWEKPFDSGSGGNSGHRVVGPKTPCKPKAPKVISVLQCSTQVGSWAASINMGARLTL